MSQLCSATASSKLVAIVSERALQIVISHQRLAFFRYFAKCLLGLGSRDLLEQFPPERISQHRTRCEGVESKVPHSVDSEHLSAAISLMATQDNQ